MEKKRNIVFVYIIGIVLVLIPIVGSVFRGEIGSDSAYYICHAQLWSRGYVPYVDFSDGYTPLWTGLSAGLKLLFHVPDGNYVFYLIVHYLYTIGVAFFIYKIAKDWGATRVISFCGACMFILMSHWLDGNLVLLEIPSLFWGMMSVWLVLHFNHKNHWNYVWIGVITAFSFLSKQFGLGFLVLNLYLMFFVNHLSWRECLCLVLGFVIPVLFCFLYWGERFIPVVFSGYGTKTAAAAGYDVSFVAKMKSIARNLGYFLKMVCPAIVVSLLFVPTAICQKRFSRFLFCYCGIIGFSLQYYFVSGGFHYMLYMVSFAILLMILMMNLSNEKWLQYVKYGAFIIVLFVSFYKTYNNRVYKLYVKRNVRKEQLACGEEVKQHLSDGSLWVAHGVLNYLYLTTGALPPNLSTIGYSFGPLGLDEEKAFAQAKAADNVVCFSVDFPYEVYFTDSLDMYLKKHQSVTLNDGWVLLYDMHKPLKAEN